LTVTLPRDVWQVSALDASGAPTHALAVHTAAESKLSTSFEGAALSYSLTR
jgi:hypothetical protein